MKRQICFIVLCALLLSSLRAAAEEHGFEHAEREMHEAMARKHHQMELMQLDAQMEKMKLELEAGRRMAELDIQEREVEIDHMHRDMDHDYDEGDEGGYEDVCSSCDEWEEALECMFLWWIVVNILLAVWVYRDIKDRKCGSGLWIILALIAGLPAALIYAVTRIADKRE